MTITITETNFQPELVELKLVDGQGNELYKDYTRMPRTGTPAMVSISWSLRSGMTAPMS